MEIINHLIGTCGEFHPNLFTLLILMSGIYFIKRYETNNQK